MALMDKVKSQMVNWGLIRKREREERFTTASSKTYGGLWDLYGDQSQDENKRSEVYEDMDWIDDELIARVLDMIADDATQINYQKNKSVWITSRDPETLEILQDLFKRLNVEERIWLWAREVAKYGDFFLRLVLAKETGIQHADDRRHPETVVRLENRGKLVGFAEQNEDNQREWTIVRPWDYVHFRTLRYRIKEDIMPRDLFQEYKVDRHPRYGSSSLIKARRIEKKVQLAEDSMVLARLSRSQFFRVHYVNVGQGDPKEQKEMMNTYEGLFENKDDVNYDADYFESQRNPMSFADQVFIPVKGEKGRSEIEDFGGEVDVTSIVDIEYLNNKRFGAIGVPKEYLSFDSTLSFNSLASLDPRYARKVATIQRALRVGLQQLCQIELWLQGKNPDADQFQVHFNPVSHVDELEKTDAINSMVDVAERLMGFFEGYEGVDRDYLYRYITTNYLNLPNVNIDKLFSGKQKQEEPGGEPAQNGQAGAQMGGGADPTVGPGLGGGDGEPAAEPEAGGGEEGENGFPGMSPTDDGPDDVPADRNVDLEGPMSSSFRSHFKQVLDENPELKKKLIEAKGTLEEVMGEMKYNNQTVMRNALTEEILDSEALDSEDDEFFLQKRADD